MYYVTDYPADGETCRYYQRTFNCLTDARDEVTRRLGDTAKWRVWAGIEVDTDLIEVEAYHASKMVGCGGVQISKSA